MLDPDPDEMNADPQPLLPYRNDTDVKLKTLEAEKAAAEKKAAGAAAEMAEMRRRIADLESEAGATSGEVREKMRTTALELEAAKEKILGLETKEEELRSQVIP
jgi:hypothetical protein